MVDFFGYVFDFSVRWKTLRIVIVYTKERREYRQLTGDCWLLKNIYKQMPLWTHIAAKKANTVKIRDKKWPRLKNAAWNTNVHDAYVTFVSFRFVSFLQRAGTNLRFSGGLFDALFCFIVHHYPH